MNNQQQQAQWQAQWEQDLYAQSLLSNQGPVDTGNDLAEAAQEADVQKLMQRFPHVDEGVVYGTYFEQASRNYSEAFKLIQVQFPEDPAFKVQNKHSGLENREKIVQKQEEEKQNSTAKNRLEYFESKQIEEFSEAPQGKPILIDGDHPNQILPISEKTSQKSSLLSQDKEISEVGQPQDMENSLDLTEEISKEILMHLRIRLGKAGKEAQFFAIIKILAAILQNIVRAPTEQKYQKLKLNNKKINETITSNLECMNLLEVLGFSQQQDIISQEDGLQMLMVISQQDVLDQFQRLSKAADMIGQMSEAKNIKSLTKHFEQKTPGSASKGKGTAQQQHMSRAQKDKQINQMANHSQNMKSRLLSAHADRHDRRVNQPELIEEQRAVAYQNDQLDTYLGQMQHYKKMQQRKWITRPKKMVTIDDLQKKIDEDIKIRNNGYYAGKGTNSENWGIRCLDLTNKFRAATDEGHEGNKSALKWDQALHDIALEHSINMAEGRVPFGHGGFDNRAKKVPYFYRAFSENVAYNMGTADPVEVAVRGWINSPGHRKNMLAMNTRCAIAVHQRGGYYYFTQLFALA